MIEEGGTVTRYQTAAEREKISHHGNHSHVPIMFHREKEREKRGL